MIKDGSIIKNFIDVFFETKKENDRFGEVGLSKKVETIIPLMTANVGEGKYECEKVMGWQVSKNEYFIYMVKLPLKLKTQKILFNYIRKFIIRLAKEDERLKEIFKRESITLRIYVRDIGSFERNFSSLKFLRSFRVSKNFQFDKSKPKRFIIKIEGKEYTFPQYINFLASEKLTGKKFRKFIKDREDYR